VGTGKVLGWIARGELPACNTASNASASARPRYVIRPADLDAFRRGRQVVAQAPRKRRRRRAQAIDSYPD
jgi:hypothetical protein